MDDAATQEDREYARAFRATAEEAAAGENEGDDNAQPVIRVSFNAFGAPRRSGGRATPAPTATTKPGLEHVNPHWLAEALLYAVEGRKTELQNKVKAAHWGFRNAAKRMAVTNPGGMKELIRLYQSYMRGKAGLAVTRQQRNGTLV